MAWARRKKNRITSKKSTPRRGIWLAALFLLLCLSLAASVYLIFLHSPDQPRRPLTQPVIPGTPAQKSAFQEKTPDPLPRNAEPRTEPELAEKAAKPRIAIIIDDMGYQLAAGKSFLELDLNLSFSFLPFAPFNTPLLAEARARGRDILLHLPLESEDPGKDPGPGALTTAMDTATLREELRKNLANIPWAIGINNHMGSRFTADPQAMARLFPVLREKNLFFLDSLTTPASTATGLAAAMRIKTGRRDVFLDNEQDAEKIIKQLSLLLKIAGHQGQAVAIGHPHPATLEALRRYRTELLDRVEMVGVSRLVH